MCGIVAAVNINLEKDTFLRSLDTIKPRGPDSEGVWLSPSGIAWLGHRRLSIVDLSDAGRQPMKNENQTLWLSCNGEIYNHPSLRKDLEKAGHRYFSNSDSESIIHAYEEWGVSCLDRIEGMFAFVLWDEKRKRLFAARDRVGIKPLYFSEHNQGIVVASLASTLLPLLGRKPDINPLSVAYLMTLGYVPSPYSIWQGIRKLDPGHYLIWDNNSGIRTVCWWQPPGELASPTKHCVNDVWEGLFSDVLKEHLLSDVPLGLFLSGGIDSSCIGVGLHEAGRSSQALSVSFPHSKYDEAPIAKSVAEHLGFTQRIIPLSINNVLPLLRKVSETFDEPQGYGALLTMHLVCAKAASYFKAVLSGDGGDELFAGYTWYQNPLLYESGKKGLLGVLKAMYSSISGESDISNVGLNADPKTRQRAFKIFSQKSLFHHHALHVFPRFLPEECEALLEPLEFRFSDNEMLEPLKRYYSPKLPVVRALQRIDLMTFCSDSILAKVDRASMGNGLEVRVPFLDRRVVEWALALPVEERGIGEGKQILREYLRQKVPENVLTHPKQGFSLRVMDDFDWDHALDIISESWWVRSGYWHKQWYRLVEKGVPFRNGRIWVLLALSDWADVWL